MRETVITCDQCKNDTEYIYTLEDFRTDFPLTNTVLEKAMGCSISYKNDFCSLKCLIQYAEIILKELGSERKKRK